MIKAKEVSIRNLVVLLVFSLAVTAGYYLTRSHVTAAKSVPIFMGEEVVVQRALTAVTAKRAVKAVTAQMAPVPAQAVPLPIVPPSITFKVLPTYPTGMLEKGIQGTVLLSVYVGLGGQPEKIETRASSGVIELDESAVKAVSQWRFSPAMQGGGALASWFEVPVRFELK